MNKRGTERDLSPEGNGQHGSEAKGAGSAVDRDRRRAMIRGQLREAERTRQNSVAERSHGAVMRQGRVNVEGWNDGRLRMTPHVTLYVNIRKPA